MNRKRKIIRNLIILIVLFAIFIYRNGLYFTPLSAHESSERSIHYGPSEVVHIQDYEKGKYILGKYDKWVSCNTVNKSLFFFWKFGDQVIGFENDPTKAVDYTWSGSYESFKLYGIINDKRIKKIDLTFSNDEVLTTTKFYDDLFLFAWDENGRESMYVSSIKGYDGEGKVIFVKDQVMGR